MKCTLADYIQEVNIKTTKNNEYPILTSSRNGVYLQSEYFNKQVASNNNIGYKIIEKGQFTYRAMSDTGKFYLNRLTCIDKGIVSPAYPVFKIVDETKLLGEYLQLYFRSDKFQNKISLLSRGSTRTSIKLNTIKNILLDIPNIFVQEKIISNIKIIEDVIELRKNQLEKLDLLVKSRFMGLIGDQVSNPYNFERGKIRDVVSDVKYGTSKAATDNGKYPYLRMGNITYDGNLDLTNLKYIDIPDKDLSKCIVQKGDVLFNRTNSKELVGKTCVFNLDDPMVIAGYIIRVRTNEKVLPEYLSAVLNSKYGKQTLYEMCKSIVGQANINAQELQDIKILIPPLEQQIAFRDFQKQVSYLSKIADWITFVLKLYLKLLRLVFELLG